MDGIAERTGGEGGSSNLGVSAGSAAKKAKPTYVTHTDKGSRMLDPHQPVRTANLLLLFFFPRPVFRFTHVYIFLLGIQNCSNKCCQVWLVYAQISTLRCVAVGGVTSCTLVCFPLLVSPSSFVGWAVHVSVSCVGMCLTRIVGVIVCGRICVSTCVFMFYAVRSWVARPRSPLCRIYHYTPTHKIASAFSQHVIRAGSCVPQREVQL